ncbi:Retrovirus-related Pol polyprotein from transposon TNT 1-94 [Cucumis melo var. makuwa]|uniref:Retrovirus-related Pol polyprotein from transposon TNT 1-94 n=1 Tax=Cucumis melo var. makuwa TaxID=1194695 RepID=A0A5D3CMJ4_CUCMM|nr:Retrovirus-related Pol polyprotein from transposon TNT 1-94 [Cucumis melo var. makuwa]TYK11646.1 Retrovirus-related Pol polyprotein from transposon TNT 1-94 [Cucumis melo var. makuwa]
MKDLGEADIILGVKIRKNKASLSLCQSHYVEKILKKFDFFDVSPARTSFDASKHLKKNKRDSVSQSEYAKIIGYCDANWVTDNDEVNSTSGSTMESEFIALELAGQEAEWIKNLLGDVPLWGTFVPVSIQCDSQAAICTAKNSVYNGKSRHIRLRHVVVKQLLKEGTISLEFVRSEKNLADPLTKGLTRKMVLDSSVNMGLKPFGDPQHLINGCRRSSLPQPNVVNRATPACDNSISQPSIRLQPPDLPSPTTDVGASLQCRRCCRSSPYAVRRNTGETYRVVGNLHCRHAFFVVVVVWSRELAVGVDSLDVDSIKEYSQILSKGMARGRSARDKKDA